MTYLRNRSFDQDPLKNLFTILRQQGHGNTNPSCLQFAGALKASVLNNLASSKNPGSNCKENNSNHLNNMVDLLNTKEKPAS